MAEHLALCLRKQGHDGRCGVGSRAAIDEPYCQRPVAPTDEGVVYERPDGSRFRIVAVTGSPAVCFSCGEPAEWTRVTEPDENPARAHWCDEHRCWPVIRDDYVAVGEAMADAETHEMRVQILARIGRRLCECPPEARAGVVADMLGAIAKYAPNLTAE